MASSLSCTISPTATLTSSFTTTTLSTSIVESITVVPGSTTTSTYESCVSRLLLPCVTETFTTTITGAASVESVQVPFTYTVPEVILTTETLFTSICNSEAATSSFTTLLSSSTSPFSSSPSSTSPSSLLSQAASTSTASPVPHSSTSASSSSAGGVGQTQTDNDSQSSHSQLRSVVGGAVGAVTAFILLLAFLWFRRRRTTWPEFSEKGSIDHGHEGRRRFSLDMDDEPYQLPSSSGHNDLDAQYHQHTQPGDLNISPLSVLSPTLASPSNQPLFSPCLHPDIYRSPSSSDNPTSPILAGQSSRSKDRPTFANPTYSSSAGHGTIDDHAETLSTDHPMPLPPSPFNASFFPAIQTRTGSPISWRESRLKLTVANATPPICERNSWLDHPSSGSISNLAGADASFAIADEDYDYEEEINSSPELQLPLSPLFSSQLPASDLESYPPLPLSEVRARGTDGSETENPFNDFDKDATSPNAHSSSGLVGEG